MLLTITIILIIVGVVFIILGEIVFYDINLIGYISACIGFSLAAKVSSPYMFINDGTPRCLLFYIFVILASVCLAIIIDKIKGWAF